MYLGSIVEVSPAEELYDNPLHPYTISLLSAVPIPDPAVESERETILLSGDIPALRTRRRRRRPTRGALMCSRPAARRTCRRSASSGRSTSSRAIGPRRSRPGGSSHMVETVFDPGIVERAAEPPPV